MELRSEWRVMWLEVDIAAFDCDNWPTHLLWNAWSIKIESKQFSNTLRIDAPGWSEHIAKLNFHRCLSGLQSFNPQMITATIQTLVCPPYCGKEIDMRELSFTHYPNLHSIHISSFSFPHVLSVTVQGLAQLKEFVVEHQCFCHPQTDLDTFSCTISDCPLLEGIDIGYGSFANYSAFSLKSCLTAVEWRIDLPHLKSLTVGSEVEQACFCCIKDFELRGSCCDHAMTQ